MRQLITAFIAFLLAALPNLLRGQDDQRPQTLLGNADNLHHGGWGAPTGFYTRIMDQDALLLGARGGWIINHRFTLGLAGHGLVTQVHNAAYDQHLISQGQTLTDKSRLFLGYGGLLLEPIIAYRSPIHVSLPIIIGAGGAGYSYSGPPPPDFDPLTYKTDGQAFFVFEPGLDLELNLIPLLRIGLGVSYRYTSDLDIPGTAKDALHGFNAGMSIKVGRF
ncbi:MAG: hypothetical protein JNM31_05895 [Flavobacteriales bacterium]|nr:hypothetical protein [Flavobacteriales bacterium]